MASQQPYQLTARTLALSDVIPTQAADGATEVGKNTIQDVADLITAGSIVTVKIPVSSAEILQLFTTPKVLVPAPGAGKFIKVFSTMLWNQAVVQGSDGKMKQITLNSALNKFFSHYNLKFGL